MVFNAQNGKIGFNKGFLNLIKPEDFDKINKAIQLYNQRVNSASGNQAIFAESMKRFNPQLSSYLTGLNGANASMKGYGIHLVGATIKTVALQAASMALNAALTWGVSLAIQGIIAGVQALWKLVPTTEHLKKSLEETAQALADIRSERESLNDELKTTEERIAELEAKGTLSFTDEAELNRLRQENAELERKLILLDDEERKEEEKYRKKFNKFIGGDRKTSEEGNYFSLYKAGEETTVQGVTSRQGVVVSDIEYLKELGRAYHDAQMAEDGYFVDARNGYKYSAEDIQKRIDNMSDNIADYQKYLSDLYENGFDYSTADEETKKNVDFANEMIDTYMVVIGKTDTLWSQVYNRDRFTEARSEIEKLAKAGNLSAESLQNLYNQGGNVKEFIDYMLSLNTVDWKTILGDDFDRVAKSDVDDGIVSVTEALGWMNEKGENSAKVMGLFANELNKVEDAADKAETSFKSIAKTLSDGLDKLSDKKDILSEVKEQLDSFGAISADNISKILEQFSDNDDVQKAVAYYLSGIGTAQQLYDVMAKGYQNDLKLQAQNLADKMQNDENYFNALKKLHGGFGNFKVGNYNIDLSNEKNLAKAKLKIETHLISSLKEKWSKYYTVSGNSLEEILESSRKAVLATPELSPERQKAYEFYNSVKEQINAYNKAVSELNKLSSDNFDSSGFNASLSTNFDDSSKSGKTEAEKYFEKLKYQLDTNQITQEQYLKSLDSAYKRFYNKTADYLEDYAKYSQEVYDGFKDMYKEDLEAQKDAWEKKKDAVSEYYDKLREEIENTHDEEDYEKEQSEKRKEIFDLDMQIAELMRDGSEKAKARIAELEEERLKAEEELRDFETDKAREDELSRLEKEQKAEEDKIQQQIDGIQGQLDKLDKDTVSVRNAIIAYAKEKGVTLNFAYASGTRSSVGGFGRINEKGIEMISAPDGNGNYVNLMPNSYVFSAKATEFLWKLATEHSLPQAMYNSIAKSIKTQSSTPSVNIALPITITMGDIIIKGNADKQTVADIKKEQENTVRMVLQKIKELQK